jgi:hypothetical protein
MRFIRAKLSIIVYRSQKLVTVQCVPKDRKIKAVIHYHHGLGDYALRNKERACPQLLSDSIAHSRTYDTEVELLRIRRNYHIALT